MTHRNADGYESLIQRLFQSLISGDRPGSRDLLSEALEAAGDAKTAATEILWPTVDLLDRAHRSDRTSLLAHRYATRLMRSLLDRLQVCYENEEPTGRRMCLFCGPGETEELAGLLLADLAEAAGHEVFFGGGGVPADEILAEVAAREADLLVLFAAAPSDAPGIRGLIDEVREVGARPDLQIAVGGGVFHRAEGLAEEIGADLWAHDPTGLLEEIRRNPERRATPEQRTVGRTKPAPAGGSKKSSARAA